MDGGGGWLGGAPHTSAHARTCMCGKHDNSMQMAAPIGFGEIPGIPYDVICVCACMRVHVHMCKGDPVGVGGWVDQCVNGWGQVKPLKI